MEIDGALPMVRFGDVQVAATSADGCEAVEAMVPTRACTSLTVRVPAGALPGGLLPVVVEHAEEVGCESIEAVQVRHVGAPAVAAIEPMEICTAAGDVVVLLTGADFAVGGSAELYRSGSSWRVAWAQDLRGRRPWTWGYDPR